MKRKMLIIDDDRGVLESFEALFGDEYELILSHSPRRALEILKSEDPFLIFLDILMPNMDGLEVLKRLKKMGKASKVVLITASDDAYQGEDGIYCLKKPFDIRELRRITADAVN